MVECDPQAPPASIRVRLPQHGMRKSSYVQRRDLGLLFLGLMKPRYLMFQNWKRGLPAVEDFVRPSFGHGIEIKMEQTRVAGKHSITPFVAVGVLYVVVQKRTSSSRSRHM